MKQKKQLIGPSCFFCF